MTLRWRAVSDPSGVVYSVVLGMEVSGGTWPQVGSWNDLAVTQKDVPGIFLCDYGWSYRWRVRARDGVGNANAWPA